MSGEQRRVVITGAGGISPLGNDWGTVLRRLRACRNAVQRMDDWDIYQGLNTKLGAPAAPLSCRRTTTARPPAAWAALR